MEAVAEYKGYLRDIVSGENLEPNEKIGYYG